MKPLPEKEGCLTINSHKVWYKIVGDKESPGKLPLLCLHGGPGGNHLYLKPLEQMAATGRRVIFYDQLGCGNSDHPDNPALWTVPFFVEELNEVREQLGLKEVHLHGQSWGGMLAMESYFAHPEGVASLTLGDALASTSQWISEANRLRAELPRETQAILDKHEKAGTTESPEYQEAMMVYYRRHVCRLKEWPDYLLQSLEVLSKYPAVYLTMWGPSEFYQTGNLKTWDIREKLNTIHAPALVLSGRHDESTPLVSGEIAKGIPGAKWVIFEHSAHMPHIEETALYMKTLDSFLTGVETARKSGK